MRSFARDLSFPRLGGQRAGGGGAANPELAAILSWVNAGSDGALIDPTSPRWQDSAQTTEWATDGDPVGYVEDLSSFGSDLSQATSGNRPTGHNGYLLNNGTSAFLEGPNKVSRAGWYFAASCMVPAFGGGAGNRNVLHIGTNIGADGAGQQIRGDADVTRNLVSRVRVLSGSSFLRTTNTAFTYGTAFLFEAWNDGTDLFLAVDGGSPTTAPAAIGATEGNPAPLFLWTATTVQMRVYAAAARLGLPTGTDRADIIIPYLQSVLP
jgi:hypothetical protein